MPINCTSRSGPAWRVARCGSTEVYFSGWVTEDGKIAAQVFSHGQRSVWAKKPMVIPAADLFETKAEALAEFRNRRKADRPIAASAGARR